MCLTNQSHAKANFIINSIYSKMSYEYDFTAITTYTGKYLTLWWVFFFIQIVLINLKWVLFKSKYNAVKVNLKQLGQNILIFKFN